MKQLYFTSCSAGRSLSGEDGFKVRAVTPGLDPARLKAAVRYVGYALHASINPDDSTARTAPVRFALVDTPDVGRIFLRSAYIGRDPTTGRFGNHFTHLLLDVPASLDGAQAIACWDSPFWRTADGDFGTALPEVAAVPPGRTLDDRALARFLADEPSRRMLTFALAAFLDDGDGRIYLAAPADQVALCAYGLARLAPTEAARGLTFSTYEMEPLSSYARLVGTCWPAGAADDLPSSCYLGSARGFNRFRGQQTPLATTGTYATFSVAAVASGDWAAVDRVRHAAARLGIAAGAPLDLLQRIESASGEPDAEALASALADARLAPWVAARPGVASRVVALAAESPALAAEALPRVLTALGADNPARTGLLRALAERAAALTAIGDPRRARPLLDRALAALTPAEADTLRADVLAAVARPEDLSWESRAEFLRLLPPPGHTAPVGWPVFDRRRWLAVPAADLDALLALDLAEADKLLACRAAIHRDGADAALVARAIAPRRDLGLAVLEGLARDPETAADAARLFAAVTGSTAPGEWLDALLACAPALPAATLGTCLAHALADDRLDVSRLAEAQGSKLVALAEGGRCLGPLVDRLLDAPAPGPQARAILDEAARSPALDETRRERIRTQVSLETFLALPTLDPAALRDVVAALGRLPERARRAPEVRVVKLVTAQLLRMPRAQDAGAAFEEAVKALGPLDSAGPAGAYVRLARGLQRPWSLPWRRGLWRRPDLLSALIGVPLGQFRTADLPRHWLRLEPAARAAAEVEAERVASRLLPRGGARALAALDRQIALERWNRGAAERWRRIRPEPGGKPARGFIAEIAPVVIAMLVTIVVLGAAVLWLGRSPSRPQPARTRAAPAPAPPVPPPTPETSRRRPR